MYETVGNTLVQSKSSVFFTSILVEWTDGQVREHRSKSKIDRDPTVQKSLSTNSKRPELALEPKRERERERERER